MSFLQRLANRFQRKPADAGSGADNSMLGDTVSQDMYALDASLTVQGAPDAMPGRDGGAAVDHDMVALPLWIGALMQFYGFSAPQAGITVTLFLAAVVVSSPISRNIWVSSCFKARRLARRVSQTSTICAIGKARRKAEMV